MENRQATTGRCGDRGAGRALVSSGVKPFRSRNGCCGVRSQRVEGCMIRDQRAPNDAMRFAAVLASCCVASSRRCASVDASTAVR